MVVTAPRRNGEGALGAIKQTAGGVSGRCKRMICTGFHNVHLRVLVSIDDLRMYVIRLSASVLS